MHEQRRHRSTCGRFPCQGSGLLSLQAPVSCRCRRAISVVPIIHPEFCNQLDATTAVRGVFVPRRTEVSPSTQKTLTARMYLRLPRSSPTVCPLLLHQNCASSMYLVASEKQEKEKRRDRATAWYALLYIRALFTPEVKAQRVPI